MEHQTAPLLKVQNLSVSLQQQGNYIQALNDISFEINAGETFALLGESGCGKSLTSLAINQLLPASGLYHQGSHIYLDEQDLLDYPEVAMREIRGKRIAMIFQEPMTSLNPVMSIGKQIMEVLKLHSTLSEALKRKRVLDLLQDVGIADNERIFNSYAHQLSGGMKQRAMIAMSLAVEPDLLIADEPTTALDVTIQAQIMNLLQRIQRERGMAMLLISHDLSVVSQFADRVAIMYAGQMIEQAPAKQFFQNPSHPYSRKLFAVIPDINKRDQQLAAISGNVPSLQQMPNGCRFAQRCDYQWRSCHEVDPNWSTISAEHQARCHLYNEQYNEKGKRMLENGKTSLLTQHAHGAIDILQTHNMKVHFPIKKGILQRQVGCVKAVDDVNICLQQGKTLALVGESGCGKTTLGKALLHLIEPTDGSIVYAGQQLNKTEQKQLRQELQIIFQDPFSSLNPRMLVKDIIAEGIRAQGLIKDRKKLKAKVIELMNKVGLPEDSLYRYPHEFSGGQRQRIGIARALAVKPKIIVCDEPTSALDLSVQAQILNLLQQLQRDYGLSYLFITHDISVVSYMADKVAVMYLGRIVEQGDVKTILQQAKHPYTQLLLAAAPSLVTSHRLPDLKGEQPSPANPPSGCHFHPRCKHAMEQCKINYPEARQLSKNHKVKCYLYEPQEQTHEQVVTEEV